MTPAVSEALYHSSCRACHVPCLLLASPSLGLPGRSSSHQTCMPASTLPFWACSIAFFSAASLEAAALMLSLVRLYALLPVHHFPSDSCCGLCCENLSRLLQICPLQSTQLILEGIGIRTDCCGMSCCAFTYLEISEGSLKYS